MTQTLRYQTAQLLDDAADVIQNEGWTRGAFYRDHGDRRCYCLLGALIKVQPDAEQSALAARRALRAETHTIALDAWNDAQCDRRKVIRLLRRTARKVRRGQISV